MSDFFNKLLNLLLLLLGSSSLEIICARDVEPDCSTHFGALAYHAQRNFLAKVAVRFPEDTKHPYVMKVKNESGFGFEIPSKRISLVYGRRMLGLANSQIHEGSLRFDIDVKPAYHQLGIYQYMMATALEANPETKEIPGVFNYAYSENARIFTQKLGGSLENYLERLSWTNLHHLNRADLRQLRAEIIKAVYEMPAVKVRTKLGFGKITRIEVEPRRNFEASKVSLVAVQAPRVLDADIRVLVLPKRSSPRERGFAILKDIWNYGFGPALWVRGALEIYGSGETHYFVPNRKDAIEKPHILPGGTLDVPDDYAVYGSRGREHYFKELELQHAD